MKYLLLMLLFFSIDIGYAQTQKQFQQHTQHSHIKKRSHHILARSHNQHITTVIHHKPVMHHKHSVHKTMNKTIHRSHKSIAKCQQQHKNSSVRKLQQYNRTSIKSVHKRQQHKNYMQGPASFYAAQFAGRKMANGNMYDPQRFTAAHAHLPLGTKLKVVNIGYGYGRGRILYIEVTDRMSTRPKYIIDLSPAAAQYLNGSGRGLVVKLQRISTAEFKHHATATSTATAI